jgi:hypothetical protein
LPSSLPDNPGLFILYDKFSGSACGQFTARAMTAHRYLVGSNKRVWIIDDKVMTTTGEEVQGEVLLRRSSIQNFNRPLLIIQACLSA